MTTVNEVAELEIPSPDAKVRSLVDIYKAPAGTIWRVISATAGSVEVTTNLTVGPVRTLDAQSDIVMFHKRFEILGSQDDN